MAGDARYLGIVEGVNADLVVSADELPSCRDAAYSVGVDQQGGKKQDGSEVPFHVPIMSVEGPGALISHIEPHMTTMYAPIIEATKARLMREATGEKFAEFGYRGARNDIDHISLMIALKVGILLFGPGCPRLSGPPINSLRDTVQKMDLRFL